MLWVEEREHKGALACTAGEHRPGCAIGRTLSCWLTNVLTVFQMYIIALSSIVATLAMP